MRLSKHFTDAEFERSSTAVRRGWDNTMPPGVRKQAVYLCETVLEKIRAHYNSPVIITSGYRSSTLNSAVRGSRNSQHCKGQAADITVKGVSVDRLFTDIITGAIPGLTYDQVIWEFGAWVHISAVNGYNRGEKLRATSIKGVVQYTKL